MLFLRKRKKTLRVIALFLLMNLVAEIVAPSIAFALTGGPSQPEVESFSPIGTSEMVDVSSGDFNYNIPLLDVGGYPINLMYNAGITPDQEASWVGLGWNINPGVVNRNVRGLPDDFSGDLVTKEFNMKENKTYGGKLGLKLEIVALNKNGKATKTKTNPSINVSIGVNYNNYNGYSADLSLSPGIAIPASSAGKFNIGLGLSASSTSGAEISPNVSFSYKTSLNSKTDADLSIGVGVAANSRQGLSSLTVDPNIKISKSTETQGSIVKKDKKTGQSVVKKSGTGTTSHGGVGYNFGSTISMVAPTYTPYSELSYVTESYSFSGSLGLEAKYVHPGGSLSGHYSSQKLVSKKLESPAFGYLYAQNGNTPISLHDFNREKDTPVQTTTPNVGLSNFSYDIYGVSGQGIGGSFRPYRKEIGMLYDPFVLNGYSTSTDFGLEIGAALYVKVGTDTRRVKNTSYAGGWFAGNNLYSNVSFRNSPFMKAAGEMTVEANRDFFNATGGFEAVRPSVLTIGKDQTQLESKIVSQSYNTSDISYNTIRGNKQPVTQNLLMLKQEEAAKFGLMKSINSYNVNNFARTANNMDFQNKTSISRNNYPDHHLGEIISTRPDGARYVYSIPAYNTSQKEVTFSIGDTYTPDPYTGLVEYGNGDNSTSNSKGQENYYEGISTPKYAHSYLLTAILSADYVDRTGDGPTDDDNGSYTKINYSRAVADFNWRTPLGNNKASYNEGLNSNDYKNQAWSDDKANYVYGKKDIWYVHSIETRTHVAHFIMDNRADGLGVQDENGNVNTDPAFAPKRLVKISLFAKTQIYASGRTISTISRLPIKEVNFVYDYSLCLNVPNNNRSTAQLPSSVDYAKTTINNTGGKLTLKEVYFTYGASGKGKFSSYKFQYAGARTVDQGETAELSSKNFYNIKAYDRWGNYKPNYSGAYIKNQTLTSAEFPYVEQDKGKTDSYATLWNLTKIELPSGGAIDVEYESDDYAYVQNKNAMQMFMVEGTAKAGDISNGEIGSDKISSDRLIDDNDDPRNVIVFKLANPINANSATEAINILKRDYIRNLDYMYFRFSVRMGGNSDPDTYEFVPGYIQNVNYGMISKTSGAYTHAWVQMKGVGIKIKGGGPTTNPISRAAWQFAQLYLTPIAYGNKERAKPNEAGGFEQILNAFGDALGSIQEAIQGINQKMRSEKKGIVFSKHKSWIRLYNPDGKKLGGGHRVKKIQLTDRWKELTGNTLINNVQYGQTYEYTIEESFSDGSKKTISSGVASYEPMLGGDENPHRQPVIYQNPDQLLAPRRDYYLEKPFGENYYPSPSVVYSYVKVKSIKDGTGHIIHEFYTAKDFPTQAYNTFLDGSSRVRQKPSSLAKLLKLKNYDYMTISQGYCIVLNDMHSKPKAETVYDQKNDPLSGVKYNYRQKQVPVTHKIKLGSSYITHTLNMNRLDNEVELAYKNSSGSGKIKSGMVGIDYDVTFDSRESFNELNTTTFNTNLDVSPPVETPPTPFPLPILIPGLQKEKTRFRSAVITKVINQYGILDETVAMEDGASVSTKNLLYDPETGEVLLTQTTNQFSDPIYSFTYPAHWAYDGMGPAYKNTGFETSEINNNYFMFTSGDELGVRTTSGATKRGWVIGVAVGAVQIIDDAGIQISDISSVKVIRSGRRNMQTIPIGTVITLQNPVVNNELVFAKVLNAGAVEFSDNWRGACENGVDPDQQTLNPYLEGMRGNWRAKRSYVHLTQRTQSTDKQNTNIRKDGIFESFTPFWTAPQGAGTGDWVKDDKNWQYTSEVTNYSVLGYELENLDALNRYSSALYGYQGGTLPIGVANNAKYKEIAFENFEDYFSFISSIRSKHLRIKSGYGFGGPSSGSGTLKYDTFHTGKVSLQVHPGKDFIYENVIISCE